MKYRTRPRRALAVAATILLASFFTGCARGTQRPEPCDRDCLIGVTDAYLQAMAARDPARAPVAASVKFTENTRRLSLGQGAWDTITGARDYRIYVADPTEGQVALYTVVDIDQDEVDEEQRPGLLTLRLKIEDRLVTEVESVHVPIRQRGFGSVDNLVEAAATWSEVLPPGRRRPREEMIAIADRYFETLEKQLVDYIPFTDDCLRIENGVQTANRPGAEGLAALDCREAASGWDEAAP